LRYCKYNFKVKNLIDLKPEYFTRFIAESGYGAETAETYKWAVQKLQHGYNSINTSDVRWIADSYKQAARQDVKRRKIQMPRDIHDSIIQEAYKRKYENGLAFDIARALGLRVSEITNLRMCDFTFDGEQLKHIRIFKSKGGRTREIGTEYLSNSQLEAVSRTYAYFKALKSPMERLFICKTDSYMKAFSTARNAVTGDYTHCGVHSLRKEFANDFYNREIAKGKPDRLVRQELTQLLGHGRLDVLKHYLAE
jgi:integrase